MTVTTPGIMFGHSNVAVTRPGISFILLLLIMTYTDILLHTCEGVGVVISQRARRERPVKNAL